MSSYICSPKHFNSVEEQLARDIIGTSRHYTYAFESQYKFRSSELLCEQVEEKVKAFVDTLREIQVLCVSLQYKHHHEGKLDDEIKAQLDYVMKRGGAILLNQHAMVKSMSCIRYQIETSHLKELRGLTEAEELALETLDKLINDLSYEIVSHTKEYDEAKWGID